MRHLIKARPFAERYVLLCKCINIFTKCFTALLRVGGVILYAATIGHVIKLRLDYRTGDLPIPIVLIHAFMLFVAYWLTLGAPVHYKIQQRLQNSPLTRWMWRYWQHKTSRVIDILPIWLAPTPIEDWEEYKYGE